MKDSESAKEQRRGSGLPLQTFRDDARALSPADFEERHGEAFLVLSAAELNEPTGPGTTQVHLAFDEEEASACTANLEILAYPVQRTERSAGHLVTLGRTSNNDVVIPDLSVSRFHAFVKPESNGRFLIQDATSTNGTTVNGTSVPAQGNGPAVELKSGDNVRLGQVELTFLDAQALREFTLAHDD